MRLTIGIHAAVHANARVDVARPQSAFAFIRPTIVGPTMEPHE